MTTRPATLADLDRIAPLFDAYRQFYEQPTARTNQGDCISHRSRFVHG